MGGHLDLLRSVVRRAAEKARAVAVSQGPVEKLRGAVRDLVRQQVAIDERTVASALAGVQGITEISVSIQRGAIRVEAMRGDTPLSFSLAPDGALFAPRGAKELRFRVAPEAAAQDGRVVDAVGALGGLVAGRIWAPVLRTAHPGDALVDRARDILSVDLRSVPEARRIRGAGNALAMALEVFEVSSMLAEDGALRLELRLPSAFAPG